MSAVLIALRVLVVAGWILRAPWVFAGSPAPGYTDTLVVGGLDTPTAVAFLPDGRLIITEKGGFGPGPANAAVKLFDGGTTTTLGTLGVCTDSEMGLLGVALDPAFASNGFIYLYRTESEGGCGSASGRSNQVVRVTLTGSSIGALRVLLTGMRTDGGNHDGGGLRYNPDDGKLYVGVGDTGRGDNVGCPGSSTNPYAQDLNALEGKLLRLNLDGSVPADNPFVGQAGARGEVFAFGLRNPWRFSFDPMTGKLWVGDVGDLAVEEVDIVTAGGNYGWPRCEGTRPAGCALPGDIDPIFTYAHASCSGTPPFLGTSITGGAFAGTLFGDQAGHYVFADYTADAVYRLEPNAARDGVTGPAATVATDAAGPVDVVAGPDGAIYYVALGAGQVRRVTVAGVTTTTTTGVPTTTVSTTTLPPTSTQLLSGRRLVVKLGRTLSKQRLTAISNDRAISLGAGGGTDDDPTLHDGSIRIRTNAGCDGGACDATFSLPKGSWTRLGRPSAAKGYRFRSTTGPIALVVIKARKLLKIAGKGALELQLVADPAPVDVTVRAGARQYCMRFGGTTAFRPPGRFSAKNAPTAAGCPP